MEVRPNHGLAIDGKGIKMISPLQGSSTELIGTTSGAKRPGKDSCLLYASQSSSWKASSQRGSTTVRSGTIHRNCCLRTSTAQPTNTLIFLIQSSASAGGRVHLTESCVLVQGSTAFSAAAWQAAGAGSMVTTKNIDLLVASSHYEMLFVAGCATVAVASCCKLGTTQQCCCCCSVPWQGCTGAAVWPSYAHIATTARLPVESVLSVGASWH
jgi:hypothetical protein